MKEHQKAASAPLGGDERRAVGERRPGALGEPAVRLGQHLPRHRHIVRNGKVVERALVRKLAELLRLFPRKTAAENAPAAAQLHRNEIVVGCSQPRAREADQEAAFLDPAHQPLARGGRDGADIGKDQRRQPRIEETGDRFGGRRTFGQAHVGEGAECTR